MSRACRGSNRSSPLSVRIDFVHLLCLALLLHAEHTQPFLFLGILMKPRVLAEAKRVWTRARACMQAQMLAPGITCKQLDAVAAGLMQPRLQEDGQVCVDMGPPILAAGEVPTTLAATQDGAAVAAELQVLTPLCAACWPASQPAA